MKSISNFSIKGILLSCLLCFVGQNISSQNEVELRTDGIVVPRTNIITIANPVEGMLTYNADTETLYYYSGDEWLEVGGGFVKTNNVVHQYDTEGKNDVFIFGRELPPDEAATGNLFFFDKQKGAFRGGTIQSSEYWNPENIGGASFAYGFNVKADGSNGAVALGYNTAATGDNGAIAIGYETFATGDNGATALGDFTFAIGDNGATALGYTTVATGDNGATALGFGTIASGDNSLAVGRFNDTIVSAGQDITSTSPLFIVGNGDPGSYSNAMVVRKNGLTTIQTDLVVGGDGLPFESTNGDTLFFFDKSKAAVRGGFVTPVWGANWAPDSIGFGSVSFGTNSQATGENSVAIGARNAAYGKDGATALGYFSVANANSGVVVGQFNDPIVDREYNGTNKPLFIVGNGINTTNRSNALVVRQNGEVAFENYNFPSSDGNSGEVLKTNGSGQLTWGAANTITQCPSGYEEVHNFCIESSPNSAGPQSHQVAIKTCAAANGKVPTYQQFYTAVDANILSTLSGSNRRHWMSDFVYNGGIKSITGLEKLTGPASINVSDDFLGTAHYFRCVFEK